MSGQLTSERLNIYYVKYFAKEFDTSPREVLMNVTPTKQQSDLLPLSMSLASLIMEASDVQNAASPSNT